MQLGHCSSSEYESGQKRTRKIKNPSNVTQRNCGFSLEGLRRHRTPLVEEFVYLKDRYEEMPTFTFRTKKSWL